jgi:Putative metallopeptidase
MTLRIRIFLLATLFCASVPAYAQDRVLNSLTNPNMIVSYGGADGRPEMLKWMKDHSILERIAQFLSPINLPRPLKITSAGSASGSGCPESDKDPNMFFDGNDKLIICYSFVGWWRKLAEKEPAIEGFAKQDVVAGGLAGPLLHEAGHALSHMLELPVLGREEDSADQISAILMLEFSPGLAKSALKGSAYALRNLNEDDSFMFFDEHGTASQRFYNTLCIAYGKDPDEFRSVLKLSKILQSRLDNCETEYKQVKDAYMATIAPHVDAAKVKKVRTVNWTARFLR